MNQRSDMMLQACLNGGRARSEAAGVPVTPAELSADAAAVRVAGADALHLHPRARSGAESLTPDAVGDCLLAVRAAVPGMPVGVGTGAWIEPGLHARLDLIRHWHVLPDYASVNLSEDDAPENMEILLSKGIGIEAGISDEEDAERFVTLPFATQCLRVLLEMTSEDPAEATETYRLARSVLQRAKITLPILLHGTGNSVWPMVALAKAEGHDTRVGFEDGMTLPDGSRAETNVQIVGAAIRLLA